MRKLILSAAMLLAVFAVAWAKDKGPKPVTLNLQNGQGQSVGTARLSAADHGVAIKLNLHNLQAGDIPNFVVDVKGKAQTTVVAPNVTMGDDAHSVFSGGGTALVVHAKADDGKTDPAGNAGDRIACGLITK